MRDKLGIIDFRNIIRAINEKYGIDFSNHALTSFKRRLEKVMRVNNFNSAEELIINIKKTEAYFDAFLNEISVPETEMFRDPSLWRVLRDDIFSEYNQVNKARIWLPEVTTGEDIFSLVILLKEINATDNVEVIASSVSKKNIENIKKGVYDLKKMEINDANYRRFKGNSSMTDYYTIETGNKAIMTTDLLSNVQFICDNIQETTISKKMNLIIFRNKMIYYNLPLQTRILEQLHSVLKPGGLLCIGIKETLEGYKTERNYNLYNANENIFKKAFVE